MKFCNYYNLSIVFILFALINTSPLIAQDDLNKSIRKATIFSAACPGLGQVYNKKYWKVPVIYLGLGGTMYYYFKNNQKYNEYKSAYIARTDENPDTNDDFTNYTNNNLITIQDYYRDNRDLSQLFFFLIYLLNIVDASVDAHLINYNINNNLSLRINPQNSANSFEAITLCLKYSL